MPRWAVGALFTVLVALGVVFTVEAAHDHRHADEVAGWHLTTGTVVAHAAGDRPGIVYDDRRVLVLHPADVDDMAFGKPARVRYSDDGRAVLADAPRAAAAAATVLAVVCYAAAALVGVLLLRTRASRRGA